MAFNIKDFLNEESKKELKKDGFTIKHIQSDKLHPTKENFYRLDPQEVAATKATMELVGIQQNLVVRERQNEPGEYDIIAGHKRYRAITELIDEGKLESNLIPCKVEESDSNIVKDLVMIFTNSTQRERSDFEKMQEIQRTRKLLQEYAKENDLPGEKREIIAQLLNTSKSSISRLDNIHRHIIHEFMEEYKAGNITTATANQIAGVGEDAQRILWQQYKESGNIDTKAVRATKTEEKEQVPEERREEKNEVATEETTTEQKEVAEPQHCEEPQKENERPCEPPTEETTVTVTRPQDTTDRKSLIIAGRVNPNKEYNGMNVRYFIDAVTNSNLFDTNFWREWQEQVSTRESLLVEYAGVVTEFTSTTGEMCECNFNECFTVERKEAGQAADISFQDFTELINALIYTKVIEIKTERVDVAYWGKETARELARLAYWLTENELAVLQDLALKLKERAKE